MRQKVYFKVICVLGLLLISGYLFNLPRRHEEDTKELVVKPKDYESEDHAENPFLDKETPSVSRLNVDAINSNQDNTVVWAVLGYNDRAWELDMFLDSIKDFGVILFVQSQKNSEINTVLKNHKINPLTSPYKCSGYINRNDATKEKSNIHPENVGCRKNEWAWLVRQAWSLNQNVVCFTYDNVILHPGAKKYIGIHAPDVFNGLKLSSKEFASPWCFGPKIWNRLENAFDDFCDLESYTWEQSIAWMLSRGKLDSKNEVVVPASDLAMHLTQCSTENECTKKEIRKIKKEVVLWSSEERKNLESVSKTWMIPEKTLSVGQTTWKEHAQCRGNVCEGYQFDPAGDHRVYYKRVMDGKGDTAYLIDIGPTCIDTSKVHVSPGGEEVLDVWGREEQVEFPKYDSGAFQVVDTPPHSDVNLYQKDIIRSAVANGKYPTHIDFPGTTIVYQRYDYANICFVIADLFNLFLTLEHVPSKRMLWLDGHALGNFDNITSELFNMDVLRLGHLEGIQCFERLVLMPKKYTLYYVPNFGGCEQTVLGFVEKMKRQYNITPSGKKHDTVMVRDYYPAHPRVGKEVSRKFSEKDIEDIKRKLPNAKFVKFQDIPWREQLQIVANTKNLYGIHGAGLTLGLFLESGSKLVEWMHPSRTGTLTFQHYMSWRSDVEFERLYLKDWLNR